MSIGTPSSRFRVGSEVPAPDQPGPKLSIVRLILALGVVLSGSASIIIGVLLLPWPSNVLILVGLLLLVPGAFLVDVSPPPKEPSGD